MTTTRTPLTVGERFDILSRDEFMCQACGARPGNERLQVDHILPWSLGGSHHPANLLALCDRCNNGKGASIWLPPKLLLYAPDDQGFAIWKRFGSWNIEINADGMIANWPKGRGHVWFDIERCWDRTWEEHFGAKRAHIGCDDDCPVTDDDYLDRWHKTSNLRDALEFMRAIYRHTDCS